MNKTFGLPEDYQGLICAFALRAEEPSKQLSWDEAAKVCTESDIPVWLHFNLVDSRARNWLSSCDRIPDAAREMLLADDAHIRLEVFDGAMAGFMGDLHYEFTDDPEGLGALCVYADQHWVLTGRRHPLKAVDRLRRELAEGLSVASTIGLFAHLLEHLGEMLSAIASNLGEHVDRIEDQILKGRIQEEGEELGRIRRLVVRLRRHAGAQRNSLLYFIARLPQWCSDTDKAQLLQSIERLDAIAQDLELVQERARLLQDELARLLGEATNRNLYVLSMVTTVFLPITLITGIFGMNVGGLPWLEDKAGYWWVMMCMTFTAMMTLGVLRQRGFF